MQTYSSQPVTGFQYRLKVLPLAAVCLLLCIGDPCMAGWRLFDDFEDEAVGPVGGQDGWVAGGGDNRVITDPGEADNQILYVPSDSSIIRKALSGEAAGILDGTVRTFFMRIRVANKQTFSVGLSGLTGPSEFSDFAPEIGMANSAPNLDLRVWDDDGGNYELLTQLAPYQWYNLWIRVDAAANAYAIWLNDVPGGGADEADRLTASDGDEWFDFRSGLISDMKTFYIKTAGGGSSTNFGPVHFDDIYFELTDTLNLTNPIGMVLPIAGDGDLDGCVDMDDLSLLSQGWGTGPVPPATWEEGNFDYDDQVDLNDLALMAANWLSGCLPY